jgi:hypothetical protein
MEISVNVRPAAAHAFHSGDRSAPEIAELLRCAERLGLNLQPKHPGIRDPLLSTQFSVHVQDPERAEEVIKGLRSCKAVEAAYRVPDVALP